MSFSDRYVVDILVRYVLMIDDLVFNICSVETPCLSGSELLAFKMRKDPFHSFSSASVLILSRCFNFVYVSIFISYAKTSSSSIVSMPSKDLNLLAIMHTLRYQSPIPYSQDLPLLQTHA